MRQNAILDQPNVTASETPLPANSGYEHETNLIDALTQLAYRKRLIAKVTGTAILVGVVVAFALPVRYTATTKIMPPQQSQSTAAMLMSQLTGAGGSALAAMAGGSLGLKSPNDIYVGMLTSRPIADAIIRQFDLMKVYDAKDMTGARKKLAGFTDVTSEKNGFIAISVTDKDKKRVAQMAEAYTAQLRILTRTLAVTEASQRRLFYEEQIKRTKEDLIAAELALQQIQQKKGVVQLDAQAKGVIESITLLHAQIAAKQVELQAMRSYSTESNPSVQLAENQLASLQREAAHLEASSGHSSSSTGLGLQDMATSGMEYLSAQHEVLYQQALYDMLMKQYDAAKIDEAKEGTVIQVVEPAIEPDRKTSPKRTMLVALFSIAGFFIGCILALAQWWKELTHFDPILTGQFKELRAALLHRNTAKA